MATREERDQSPLGLKKTPEGWAIRPRMPDGSRPTILLNIPPTSTGPRALEAVAAWKERRAEHERVFMEERRKPVVRVGAMTVRKLGEAWTSGELLKTHGAVEGLGRGKPEWLYTIGKRLEAYVYDEIGDKAIVDVIPEDIDAILTEVANDVGGETLTQYRGHLSKLFNLARKVLKLRKDNPVDEALKATPAREIPDFTFLYPSEFTKLVACDEVPLERRVAYVLAVYTGLRKGSLLSLTWGRVDFENGTLTVRKTKSGRSLFFELGPNELAVLKMWKQRRNDPDDDVSIFDAKRLGWKRTDKGKDVAAVTLRADLKLAGCKRARLYEEGDGIEPCRFHELRATFVSWAKRAGKSDLWIDERTGHVDEDMRDRYTRFAQVLEGLRYEPFPSLANVLPELRNSNTVAQPVGRAMDIVSDDADPENDNSGPKAAVITTSYGVDLRGIEPPTSRVRFDDSPSDEHEASQITEETADADGLDTDRKSLMSIPRPSLLHHSCGDWPAAIWDASWN